MFDSIKKLYPSPMSFDRADAGNKKKRRRRNVRHMILPRSIYHVTSLEMLTPRQRVLFSRAARKAGELSGVDAISCGVDVGIVQNETVLSDISPSGELLRCDGASENEKNSPGMNISNNDDLKNRVKIKRRRNTVSKKDVESVENDAYLSKKENHTTSKNKKDNIKNKNSEISTKKCVDSNLKVKEEIGDYQKGGRYVRKSSMPVEENGRVLSVNKDLGNVENSILKEKTSNRRNTANRKILNIACSNVVKKPAKCKDVASISIKTVRAASIKEVANKFEREARINVKSVVKTREPSRSQNCYRKNDNKVVKFRNRRIRKKAQSSKNEDMVDENIPCMKICCPNSCNSNSLVVSAKYQNRIGRKKVSYGMRKTQLINKNKTKKLNGLSRNNINITLPFPFDDCLKLKLICNTIDNKPSEKDLVINLPLVLHEEKRSFYNSKIKPNDKEGPPVLRFKPCRHPCLYESYWLSSIMPNCSSDEISCVENTFKNPKCVLTKDKHLSKIEESNSQINVMRKTSVAANIDKFYPKRRKIVKRNVRKPSAIKKRRNAKAINDSNINQLPIDNYDTLTVYYRCIFIRGNILFLLTIRKLRCFYHVGILSNNKLISAVKAVLIIEQIVLDCNEAKKSDVLTGNMPLLRFNNEFEHINYNIFASSNSYASLDSCSTDIIRDDVSTHHQDLFNHMCNGIYPREDINWKFFFSMYSEHGFDFILSSIKHLLIKQANFLGLDCIYESLGVLEKFYNRRSFTNIYSFRKLMKLLRRILAFNKNVYTGFYEKLLYNMTKSIKRLHLINIKMGSKAFLNCGFSDSLVPYKKYGFGEIIRKDFSCSNFTSKAINHLISKQIRLDLNRISLKLSRQLLIMLSYEMFLLNFKNRPTVNSNNFLLKDHTVRTNVNIGNHLGIFAEKEFINDNSLYYDDFCSYTPVYDKTHLNPLLATTDSYFSDSDANVQDYCYVYHRDPAYDKDVSHINGYDVYSDEHSSIQSYELVKEPRINHFDNYTNFRDDHENLDLNIHFSDDVQMHETTKDDISEEEQSPETSNNETYDLNTNYNGNDKYCPNFSNLQDRSRSKYGFNQNLKTSPENHAINNNVALDDYSNIYLPDNVYDPNFFSLIIFAVEKFEANQCKNYKKLVNLKRELLQAYRNNLSGKKNCGCFIVKKAIRLLKKMNFNRYIDTLEM